MYAGTWPFSAMKPNPMSAPWSGRVIAENLGSGVGQFGDRSKNRRASWNRYIRYESALLKT